MSVIEVYLGSDAGRTKALYADLERLCGDEGRIAAFLLRAQKASERAKKYRGSRYKGAAYDRKNWALEELTKELERTKLYVFGWKTDGKAVGPYKWVLYVDLPIGQVSFHSATRYTGPDYPKEWDEIRGVSAQRICVNAQMLIDEAAKGDLFEQPKT